LDKLKLDDRVVFELSSFQLEDMQQSPHVAVVLMITSEHLDYHQNQANYIAAKESIVKFQKSSDMMVINADFENSGKFAELSPAKKIWFSRKREVKQGAYVEKNEIKYKDELGAVVKICDTTNIKLKGEHNYENVCAALCVVKEYNVAHSAIVSVLENFTGLPHRLELVRKAGGVCFYNDSFSTTPETTIAAIQSFQEPLTLIVGGSSKNSQFASLGKAISDSPYIQNVLLIGEEAKKIKQACVDAGARSNFIEAGGTMKDIVSKAIQFTERGGVVLLSPACASFDMFKNYKDRGEQFKKVVLELAGHD
jgi:UDP-N-acetylmuramoylalanine--D-glutamate ligase